MDLPSSFEWSTQESEVEEKEPADRFLKFPNASQAGLKPPPPPPTLFGLYEDQMPVGCSRRREGMLKVSK